MLHAIKEVRKNGYKTIEVGTGNSSIVQLALYQKYGFRMIGVDVDFFVKNDADKIYESGIQCKDMIRFTKQL